MSLFRTPNNQTLSADIGKNSPMCSADIGSIFHNNDITHDFVSGFIHTY